MNVGMNTLLASLGNKASDLAGNTNKMQAFQSFIGPGSMGAGQRMAQTDKLIRDTTDIPNMVAEYASLTGMDPMQRQKFYNSCVEHVAGQKASLMGGYDQFTADDPFVGMSRKDRQAAKYENISYISQNIGNPSPEFAQEMAMAATLPIAKAMIPNTVWLKAFITDSCEGELTKPYYTKKRVLASQYGLNAQVAQMQPSEIMTYAPILVTPEEWERNIMIDMKYVETMNFDVASDILTDGGRELQVLVDTQAFAGLDAGLVNTVGSVAAGSTTNGFTMDSTGTVMVLETGLNPQVEHLNFANQILRNRGYRPDLIVTSPYELAVLMSQQAVLMAYAYGTREVQETGLVGQLLGNAVAWTPNLSLAGSPSSYVIYVMDSDELARTVMGYPITVYPNFEYRSLAFKLYCRLAIFYRNLNSCIKIVCSNTESGVT